MVHGPDADLRVYHADLEVMLSIMDLTVMLRIEHEDICKLVEM